MECLCCGDQSRPLFMNETWAGTLHSACTHAACEECLRQWIEADLPRCRAAGMLRVRCFAPACAKVLPQTLLFRVSSAANGLALEIDRANDRLQDRYLNLPMEWLPTVCTVCNDYYGPTLQCEACGHLACEMCTGRWVDEQLPRCAAQRRLGIRCFNLACERGMEKAVAFQASPGARDLDGKLAQRARLQQNVLYPVHVQVDCPQLGCVGLGYLGFDEVMCFLCEHQWLACDGDAPCTDLPKTLKACPACNVQIEKNGGCDHMSCRCGHQFFWSTLLPYPR